MRSHPDIVARAVLSSVEPLDFGYDMPSPLLATMQRIAFDADRDPGLAPYLPPGGLMAAIDALRERFARQPITVDPQDGGGTVVIGLADLQASLLAEAATPGSWPAFVLSLYHGHYAEWAREVAQGRQAQEYKLIGPLIDTSLGITPSQEFRLRHDPARAYVGEGGFAPYLAAASAWPTPDLGDDYRQLRPIDTPMLLVHGDWDTSTPIDNMLAQLPTSQQPCHRGPSRRPRRHVSSVAQRAGGPRGRPPFPAHRRVRRPADRGDLAFPGLCNACLCRAQRGGRRPRREGAIA